MTIGYVVLIALLGAGAAYAAMNKDKPRPALTPKKRNVAIICFGVALVCFALAVAVAMLPHTPKAH